MRNIVRYVCRIWTFYLLSISYLKPFSLSKCRCSRQGDRLPLIFGETSHRGNCGWVFLSPDVTWIRIILMNLTSDACCCCFFVGICSFFFFTGKIKFVEDAAPSLNYYWVPILVSKVDWSDSGSYSWMDCVIIMFCVICRLWCLARIWSLTDSSVFTLCVWTPSSSVSVSVKNFHLFHMMNTRWTIATSWAAHYIKTIALCMCINRNCMYSWGFRHACILKSR